MKQKMPKKIIFSTKNKAVGYTISGIYSEEELKAIVSYERSRSDRENKSFSILCIQPEKSSFGNRNRIVAMLNNLKKMLRNVDHLGWWDKQTFGILLPSTDCVGASICADKIRKNLEMLGYGYDQTIFSYAGGKKISDENNFIQNAPTNAGSAV